MWEAEGIISLTVLNKEKGLGFIQAVYITEHKIPLFCYNNNVDMTNVLPKGTFSSSRGKDKLQTEYINNYNLGMRSWWKGCFIDTFLFWVHWGNFEKSWI